MEDRISSFISESCDLHKKLTDLVPEISQAANMLIDCINTNGKILVAGNGGSAADAQHFAAELVNRFKKERRPLPCIALTTDTSIITSIGNDYSFNDIFAKQVMALGRAGDTFIGISTSGNSINVINAIDVANTIGINVISLVGQSGRIKDMSDCAICIPSDNTPRIQESHILIIHILCELIEDAFC